MTFDFHDGNIPVLFTTPHAGVNRFLDSESNVIAQQMETLADMHIDVVTDMVEQHLNGVPYDIRSLMTRMECDIERYPDDREEMNSVGMGVIYDKGIHGKPLYEIPLTHEVKYRRRHALYYPYHHKLKEYAREIISRFGTCIIVDMHSYATRALDYELHQHDHRPEICIGVNDDDMHTLIQEICSGSSYDIGVNETFKGSILPNGMEPSEYHHMESIMFEVRKDMYLHEDNSIDNEGAHSVANEIIRILNSI